jgi:hypothetical protein
LPQNIFHFKEEGGRNLRVAVFPFLGAAITEYRLFPHPIFQGVEVLFVKIIIL